MTLLNLVVLGALFGVTDYRTSRLVGARKIST